MVYAFVQDVPASWEQYERVSAAIAEPIPAGLITHLAAPTDEGYRIIDIWESEAAWQAFQTQRLEPAIATLGGPPRPQAIFRDLRPAHIVHGSGSRAEP